MTQETIDKITDTKCDHEFTVTSGREPNQYTAGVKIWEMENNMFHLDGYWDMPGTVEGLGDATTVAGDPCKPGDLPLNVLTEAQNFLFLGIDIMTEQGLRVTKKEFEQVWNMA